MDREFPNTNGAARPPLSSEGSRRRALTSWHVLIVLEIVKLHQRPSGEGLVTVGHCLGVSRLQQGTAAMRAAGQ